MNFTYQRPRSGPTQTSVLLDAVRTTPGLTAIEYHERTGLPLNSVRDALYRAVCRGQLVAVTWTEESIAQSPRGRGRPPLCYWPVEPAEGVTRG